MPQSAILYAVIANGPVVLAEYSAVQGNASLVAIQLLEKLKVEEGTRSSYTVDSHAFHILVSGGLIYVAMAEQVGPVYTSYDRSLHKKSHIPIFMLGLQSSQPQPPLPCVPPLQSLGRRVPFSFLADIHTQFSARYGDEARTASAYQFNAAFAPVLKERAAFFSDPSNDTMTRVRGEVEGLREIMVDNIERVLERGERLELLVQKTDNLSESAFVFKRGAAQLKRQMWWKNARTTSFVVAAVVALLYIVAAMICGVKLQC